MKLTTKHFDIFKKECLKWQKKLGLTNFVFYFDFFEDEERYAWVDAGVLSDYHVTISLSSIWNIKCETKYLKQIAFHEVCHILLRRYCGVARSRYISESEIDEAEHEIVRRLENLFYN